MDCNSYSYTAPGFGVDTQHTWTQCDRVTIERRNANGKEYFVILDDTNEGSNKAYNIDTAIKTAHNWLTEGV